MTFYRSSVAGREDPGAAVPARQAPRHAVEVWPAALAQPVALAMVPRELPTGQGQASEGGAGAIGEVLSRQTEYQIEDQILFYIFGHVH